MEGKVDLAFILDECKTEDVLHVEPLMKEKLKVVAAPTHRLLEQTTASIKDLESETLLLTELGCSYRTLFEELFRWEDVYPANKLSLLVLKQLNNVLLQI